MQQQDDMVASSAPLAANVVNAPSLETARLDILDMACRDNSVRPVLKSWLSTSLSVCAFRGNENPYQGTATEFRLQTTEALQLYRSLSRVEETAWTRVGASRVISPAKAGLLEDSILDLEEALIALAPSNERLLALATEIKDKKTPTPEKIEKAIASLVAAGVTLDISLAGSSSAQQTEETNVHNSSALPLSEAEELDEDTQEALIAMRAIARRAELSELKPSNNTLAQPAADPLLQSIVTNEDKAAPLAADMPIPTIEVRSVEGLPDKIADRIKAGTVFDWQSPLSHFPGVAEKMPEILDACTQNGIITARDLVKSIVADGIAPGNARKQVRSFLEGDIQLAPPSPNQQVYRTGLSLTAVRIAQNLEINLRVAYSRFDVPEAAFQNLPRSPVQPSQPLAELEFFHTKMLELGSALQRKGILTRRQLERELISEGASATNASHQMNLLLAGTVLKPGATAFTQTAERISHIAGLEPEVAYRSFMPSESLRPSRAVLDLARTVTREKREAELRNSAFLRLQTPEILAGLDARGLKTVDDFLPLFIEPNGNTEETRQRVKSVIGGEIFADDNLHLSDDAKRLADAAGMNYWDAYKRSIREAFQRANVRPGTPVNMPAR